ncbi:MAG TPA: NUDIX domain-containing protein [Ktedonobacteraceae bacterium]|jgi:8-oxo-dGTP pyrophosphatase MutT (NUDIX family)
MTMIVFAAEETRFNYRVAGIALRERQVLLQYQAGMDHWCLPGGRVEFGETSVNALRREMLEEAEETVQVGRLLWVAESFFRSGEGQKYHELGFYYLMEFAASAPVMQAPESIVLREGQKLVTFQWHEIAELERVTLYPPFLVQGIQQMPAQTVHLLDIQRD